MQSFLAWKISENELFYTIIIRGKYVAYLYFTLNQIFLLFCIFRGFRYETVCLPLECHVIQLSKQIICLLPR